MSKRLTIKDIAKEAGVSTATVSYVINNRQDQSISEETKNKVWQVVNLFNYKPNLLAKSLRNYSDDKFIAIYTADNDNILYQAEFLRFCEIISENFSDEKYELVLPAKPYKQLNNVDAIISVNTSVEDFRKIGNANFIPLIAVDTLIDDNIFFSVTTDYQKLSKIAANYFNKDFTFACLTPSDESVKNEINNAFKKVIFINSLNDLKMLNDKYIFVIHTVLYDLLKQSKSDSDIFFHQNHLTNKCKIITECLKQALSHEKFDKHKFKI